MKKNKSILVALLFLAIMLVQPKNLQRLVTIFTQNDLATQLNTGDRTQRAGGISCQTAGIPLRAGALWHSCF